MPGSELSVIPKAGHSPQFENPAAWFAALDGFLTDWRRSTVRDAVATGESGRSVAGGLLHEARPLDDHAG